MDTTRAPGEGEGRPSSPRNVSGAVWGTYLSSTKGRKGLGFTPKKDRNIQEQTRDTLFCFRHEDTPPKCGTSIYLIACPPH
eukprot:scaffold4961_cov114-Isochrysis_galbana.AAC.14